MTNEYAQRNITLKLLGYGDYTAYLESSLWREIRTGVLDTPPATAPPGGSSGSACRACRGQAARTPGRLQRPSVHAGIPSTGRNPAAARRRVQAHSPVRTASPKASRADTRSRARPTAGRTPWRAMHAKPGHPRGRGRCDSAPCFDKKMRLPTISQGINRDCSVVTEIGSKTTGDQIIVGKNPALPTVFINWTIHLVKKEPKTERRV